MNGKAIADQTIKYLGGTGRLSAMLGAKYFSYDKEGTFSFRFAMCKKANHVSFIYNEGSDLYDIKFFKVGKYESKMVQEYTGIYFDQLRWIFEKFTGLYLSL